MAAEDTKNFRSFVHSSFHSPIFFGLIADFEALIANDRKTFLKAIFPLAHSPLDQTPEMRTAN